MAYEKMLYFHQMPGTLGYAYGWSHKYISCDQMITNVTLIYNK